MSTGKSKWSVVVLGVALSITSLTALALDGGEQPPDNPAKPGLDLVVAAEDASVPPTFDPGEKVGLALVESALSLIATHMDHYGCPASSPRRFELTVVTTDPYFGTAEAYIDGGDVTLAGALVGESRKGVKVEVNSAPGDALKRAPVVYVGRHAWNNNASIFLDSAEIDLTDTQSQAVLKYDEHSIKDYFKRVADFESWEFDWGVEVITKLGYPRAKWIELSKYKKENGGDGYLKVVKRLHKPASASFCRIRFVADGYNPGGEFIYSGEVEVQAFRPTVTPVNELTAAQVGVP